MTPRFRESQRAIIEGYGGGYMGISAVPGSGKTFTLSHLAARLVKGLATRRGQEVLVVTFSNSAVNSFKARIAQILHETYQMVPYAGYRVRTLHSLAHDIVRERATLLGLPEDFQILDEQASYAILQDSLQTRRAEWVSLAEFYFDPALDEKKKSRYLSHDFPESLEAIVLRFIKQAKDARLSPEALAKLAEGRGWPLLRHALSVYEDYQRGLRLRAAVDFDDLVGMALSVLEQDEHYLERLRQQFPFILEDEAQDSSDLQERMLRLLTEGGNWVRVGDPNQAINTTFTTAKVAYLLNFLDEKNVLRHDLPVSGRSSRKIIHLANALIDWTIDSHPNPALRDAFLRQHIRPTEADDPQANPPDASSSLYFHDPETPLSPDEERAWIVKSLARWLAENRTGTVAVLVPENGYGFKLLAELKKANLPCDELLKSTSEVRQVAATLQVVLDYLLQPDKTLKLTALLQDVWRGLHPYPAEPELEPFSELDDFLRRQTHLESLLFPLAMDETPRFSPPVQAYLEEFLAFARALLGARSLPIDQLILYAAQTLFQASASAAEDLALAYKIALALKTFSQFNPEAGLAAYAAELKNIVENQRRFLGFDDARQGYTPKAGVVTVATMHAAKGLEWDRVYLASLNNYSFPSAFDSEAYVGERFFVRDSLNLEAELVAQLNALLNQTRYVEGSATRQARVEFAQERLRLLYVALTRARRDLALFWNTGRPVRESANKTPTPAFIYLKQHWRKAEG
jgi:DNA helicase-2/ATP-dependent DNA helicase PcrA